MARGEPYVNRLCIHAMKTTVASAAETSPGRAALGEVCYCDAEDIWMGAAHRRL
jgi:hypothetical protein